jgi:tRNA modification GTPase
MLFNDTIAAIATAPGAGAIAVIRLSGPDAIDLISEHFNPVGPKKLSEQDSHTIHLGDIVFNQQIIDQALVSLFKAPRSYTGENVVEISCHGSTYIQQTLLNQLIATKRCRIAEPGEFTKRAFLNGKMSLTTAEAVADLISSESEAAHRLAINQMRGGFTEALKDLRSQLIHMASMIELELDFSGEDVTFASRDELKSLLEKLKQTIKELLDSFAYGNAIKQGVSVALLGAPNAGKSTLLNALLNEERAIVSDIAGTTRDTIEDRLIIDGILFRFIDTAGIRETSDQIEKLGIVRSIESAQKADIVILLIDAESTTQNDLSTTISLLDDHNIDRSRTMILFNKIDLNQDLNLEVPKNIEFLALSAKNKIAIDDLKHQLVQRVLQGKNGANETVVSNSRHYGALHNALQEIFELESGISQNIPSDLFAISLRKVIHHLGEITGEVSTDDLLGSIFSNFCIGK